MSQLLEYLPIAVFVIVYWLMDIYWATGALMAAVVLQVGVMYATRTPISNTLKFTLAMALVFGTLTLVMHDPLFLQWKPTIVFWCMAAALLTSHYAFDRNLMKSVLGAQLELPDNAWRNLNLGWAAAFVIQGGVNLWVAYTFSMDVWVTFKLFGMLGMSLLAAIATAAYLTLGGYLDQPDASGKGDAS